jgi:hypothetical protein
LETENLSFPRINLIILKYKYFDRINMISKNYSDFKVQKEVLIDYLHVMISLQDWHGVADVAMDLRELEAKQGNGDVKKSKG